MAGPEMAAAPLPPPPPPPPASVAPLLGDYVRIHSLVSRPELNGRLGHTVTPTANGRIGIRIKGMEQTFAIRPANLEVLPSSGGGSEVLVTVGTSELASEAFIHEVVTMVNCSYGCRRLNEMDVNRRLAMGDDGEDANRVLHLAWRKGEDGEQKLVGCCSSTKSVGWAPRGCGHWGLLVVDQAAQCCGVASALVAAAESRWALELKHVNSCLSSLA